MRVWSAIGAAIVVLFAAGPAAAKTFQVTRTADTPPNGCNQGGCTLREAVIAANNRQGPDQVLLRGGKRYELTRVGAAENAGLTGDLDVAGRLMVLPTRPPKVKRATIDVNGLDRAFDTTGRFTLVGVRIVGGTTQALAGEEEGGAIRSGAGRLVLRHCELTGIDAPPLGLGAANAAVQKVEGAAGKIVVERTGIRGTDGVAVATRGNGNILVERSGLVDNFYGATTSFGSGGIAIHDSTLSGGERRAVTDFDAGGISLVRSRVEGWQSGLADFDAGAISVQRSRINGNDQDAITDFDDGRITVARSRLAGNGLGAITDFGAGGVSMTRTRVIGNGGGLDDFDGGGVRVANSRVTDNDGQGVSDFGGGGVKVVGSVVARSDDQGVQDFDAGGVKVVGSRVARSGVQGVQDFGGGGVAVVRSAVLASDSQAVQNFGAGPVVVRSSRVVGSANEAVAQLDQGALRISRSTVSGGRSSGVHVSSSALPSLIVSSTISGNRNDGDGGGIENGGPLVIRNSTIAGNRADGSGGGIHNTGELRLNNVTIARNVADADDNATGSGGGLFNGLLLSSTRVGNSVIALNDQLGGDADDCAGTFDSRGGNLRTDTVDCGGFDGQGDIVRANPKLGPLARNGGPTTTVALRRGSPAIGLARKGSAEGRDQRGRKRDPDPDSGAFER